MKLASACSSLLVGLMGLAALGACSPSGSSDGEVVNVYTARHYASDDHVYAAFTEETGITVNVIEAPGDLLIERVRADGDRSQADVVITVDAGRLWRADEAGLFQPAPELAETLQAVPANLRQPDGDWFGFASRVRVIAYAKDRVDPSLITNFSDLTTPEWAGRICVRSSNNVYNQSLLAALVAQQGADAAEGWAEGVVSNLARPPQGGDTDQIRAVAARECDVAIINHYYLARIMRSEDPGDQEIADQIGVIFADLGDGGAHVNVSGAGLAANAPHRENAIAFLEYLLSEDSQRAFAELTNEYPVIAGIAYENDVLDAFGSYNSDDVNVDALGENAGEAQRIFDRVGWP
ncbi:extracellular solute-binding protein [Oceanicaulis sp.]|uniref:extracellular solute-binding protein n=1 Tax=Oceanicaulis sp. TaxID=1924941 RepID=UPI003D274110